LAGFRNCLAEYAVHSLTPCYGLLTAMVLLNSDQMASYNKIDVILHDCVHGRRKGFSRWAAVVDFLKVFLVGDQKW